MFIGEAYKILGVSEKASLTDIKNARRTLARQYHPDINHEPGADVKMKQVNAAADMLEKYIERRSSPSGFGQPSHGASFDDLADFLNRMYAEAMKSQQEAERQRQEKEKKDRAKRQEELDRQWAEAQKKAADDLKKFKDDQDRKRTAEWVRREQEERARQASRNHPYNELNMRRSEVTDEDLLKIRSGIDMYSRMKVWVLRTHLQDGIEEKLEDLLKAYADRDHLPLQTKTLYSAMRWSARGLRVDLAARKAWIDYKTYDLERK